MLAQSGTQAIIVTINTPGTPTAGVTTYQPAESTDFDVQLLILNRETPDARVHTLSVRSQSGVAVSAERIQEYLTPWALPAGSAVVAPATRASGLVFTMPFGEDEADVTYYGRIVRAECNVAAGEDGDLCIPEFAVIGDEPSLPGIMINTGTDEIPVFVAINSWRGEADFVASGVKYIVVGLAIFD
jgi:hypothetical protein